MTKNVRPLRQLRPILRQRFAGVSVFRKFLGFGLMAFGVLLGLSAFTSRVWATGDDITTVTDSVSGYVTAAIVVGSAVILFVLGKRVLRRLIAVAFIVGSVSLAARADDIATVTTSVSGYVTAAIVVGSAVILFVLGKRVLRRLI